MRAILYLSEPPYPWAAQYFQEISPYMLPVLGKPLIEFYIDYCALCGITDILIVQQEFRAEIVDFVKEGFRWGVQITYDSDKTPPSLKTLTEGAQDSASEPVLTMEGFFFPLYDKDATPRRYDEIHFLHRRIKLAPFPNKASIAPCEEVEIDSLMRYFDLNMKLLTSNSKQLLMKGYGAEPGVFFGTNTSVERHSILTPPFVIGDNVQIEDKAQIGGNAILGDMCIIDSRSRIFNSIIFDQTYIGADLVLDKKIVYENNIIDPFAEIKVCFLDKEFTSKLEGNILSQWARQCVSSAFAAILLLLMTPFYLLFTCIGIPKHRWITYMMAGGKISPSPLPIYKRGITTRDAWFFKLSLDKYFPLYHAMIGRINLIGDTFWESEIQESMLSKYRGYSPGALTYSDSIGATNPHENVMGDLFYKHNRTIPSDIRLLIRLFLGRFFRENKKHEV